MNKKIFTSLLVLCSSFPALGFLDEIYHGEAEICRNLLLSPEQINLENLILLKKTEDMDLYQLSSMTTADGLNKIFPNYSSLQESITNSDIPGVIQYLVKNDITSGDPLWLLGSHPSQTLRRGLFDYINAPKRRNRILGYEYDLAKYSSTTDALRHEVISDELDLPFERLRKEIDEHMSDVEDIQKEDIAKSSASKMALCALYNWKSASKCAQAIDDILDGMSPKMFTSRVESTRFEVSQVDLLKEVLFSDISYYKASRNLAVKLSDLVTSEATPKKDLFDYVLEAFKDEVSDPSVAEEMAWKYIGLYSFYGAAIGRNIYSINPNARILSMSYDVVSSAIQVLDSRLHGSNRLFSIPKQFSTQIETGKPYHFWASAYLTRNLVKKGYSKSEASSAVWLAQIGYQMLSRTTGRDPLRAFQLPIVSHANLKIRFDLVNSAAGIRFGVDDRLTKPASIDNAFKLSLIKSKNNNVLTKREAEDLLGLAGIPAYKRWTEIFQPKLIYNEFKLFSL